MTADELPPDPRVRSVHVYPVKSCAGVAVTQWPITRTGLAHDRSFMIVDGLGRFLTQREQPRLATLRPQLDDDSLTLRAPDGGSVTLPLTLSGPAVVATVWEHTGPAVDAGDAAAALVSDHLGIDARVVGLAADHHRRVDPTYSPVGTVGFSDGYPLLVIGTASLSDLNARLAEPLPMERFRPNLVVSGAPPYAEDGWERVDLGDPVQPSAAIELVKPCARCTITTVDQATGRRDGAEPLRELGRYRRGPRGVLFGMNAVVTRSGTVAVGDQVTPC